jgi:protein involved in polysaccharide export with SLBB domain
MFARRSVFHGTARWSFQRAVLLGLTLAMGGCADYPRDLVPPVPSESAAPELYRPEPGTSYAIAPGDSIAITSYYHPELKQSVTIQPDGLVSLVLIGEVTAAGKTPRLLAKELAGAYGKYLNDAEVTVTLSDSAGLSVYVGGEVAKPTMLSMKGELTLSQSIAQAGGFLPGANREQVLIVRQTADNHYRTMQANPEQILRNEAEEIYLRRHDVVYVPKTQIAKIGLFVDQYINQVIPRAVGMGFGYSLGMLGGAGGGATAVVAPGH